MATDRAWDDASELAPEPSLVDAHRRVTTAERALSAFAAPASLLDLTEADASRLHALRDEHQRAQRALESVRRRIADARLEFHE